MFQQRTTDNGQLTIFGWATLQEIRKMGLLGRNRILTGHGSINIALKAMRLVNYIYLTKPRGIEELPAKIEDASSSSAFSRFFEK